MVPVDDSLIAGAVPHAAADIGDLETLQNQSERSCLLMPNTNTQGELTENINNPTWLILFILSEILLLLTIGLQRKSSSYYS